MKYEDYGFLAQLALKSGIHEIILEIIYSATTSPLYRVDKDSYTLYYPALVLLAHHGKHAEFVTMINYLRSHFQVSEESLKTSTNYSKLLLRNVDGSKLDKVNEDVMVAWSGLKERHAAQRDEARALVNDLLEFMKSW